MTDFLLLLPQADVTISPALPSDYFSMMLVRDHRPILTYINLNTVLGFPGTFSQSLQAAGLPNGGADGSILSDPNEVLRAENNGLQNIVAALVPLPDRFGVSPGDIVQVRRFHFWLLHYLTIP